MEKQSEFVLVNITEQLVRNKVRELMKDFDMCQCEKCYLDACAIILNQQFDSHYVTTRKGELLMLLDATGYQYKTDLTVSVLQALKAVQAQPQH